LFQNQPDVGLQVGILHYGKRKAHIKQEARMGVTNRGEGLYPVLLNLVLQENGLDALVVAVSEFVRSTVVILDNKFNTLVSSDDLSRCSFEGIKNQLQEGLNNSCEGRLIELDEGGRPLVCIQPVRAGADILGYLCILDESQRISALDTIAVEQAALVIALDFQKRLAVEEIERRYLNDFVRDLLEGRIESRASAMHRANIYKWDLTKPQVLFAIRLVTQGGHGVSHTSIEAKMYYLQKLEKVIRGAMITHSEIRYLVAYLGDVNAILLIPKAEGVAAIKQESIKIAKYLIPQLQGGIDKKHLEVKIGISRVCNDVFSLPAAFREAREAIQMNVEMDSSSEIVHYDDLGINRLLLRVTDLEEMEKYCEEHLGELIRYDKDHRANLLKTLSVVIETDGNLKDAAQKLFIHYNTLRYRIRRIKEVAGIEFSSWRKVARVVLAIQAYHILQARKNMK
jgi:purine catabolism regulator